MKQCSYKNSGIQWLSEIPEHWGVTKVKKEFRVIPSNVDKKSHDEEEEVKLCNYIDVYYNDFITSEIDFMVATASEHEIKKFQLELGDILITKDSEDPYDIAVPALVKKIEDKLLCGYHLSMIRTINQKIDGAFLFWSLKDDSIVSQLFREATGVTRWAIASRHIKNSTIAFPTLPEQKVIAEYLDKACARIDRIIAIKEEQLRKIEGYFHNKLHETITQGINKSEFKEGNNTYMGKVPKDWIIDRIKDVCEFNPVKSKAKCLPDEMVSLFPMENISDDGKILGRDELLFSEIDSGLNYFENGDVIFAKITPCMENGKGAFIEDVPTRVSFGSTEFFVLRPNFRLLGKFIYYATRNYKFRAYLEANMKGAAGQQRVPSKFFQYCEITFPKERAEQQAIIKYIDELKIKTDNLLTKAIEQINTLRTYRKSLIHECVTGKKQVYTGELITKKNSNSIVWQHL